MCIRDRLKPDLIVAWQSGNAAAHVDKLRGLGFPIYVSQPNRIEDVASELERLGVLAGTSSDPNKAASQFRERLAGLQNRYSTRPPVRTFDQIGKQPLSTIGGKQISTDVVRLCGGENVFAKLATLAPTVTVEAGIAANPEAIIASGMRESRDVYKRQAPCSAA